MYTSLKDFFVSIDINTDILEPLHSGIAIFDSNANLVFANNAYKKMYNIEDKEYIGMSATSLFITANQGILEVLKTGKINSCTSVTVNGLYGITYRYPLKNKNGEIVGCMTENISVALNKEKISEMQNIIEELESQDGFSNVVSPKQSMEIITFDTIVGESASMRSLKNKGKRFAQHDESILILGENGTGKDMIAQAVHAASQRRLKNFVTVNCAAIPHELMESELFGYEAGAFTGARASGKKGKFELAEGGSIFLDEIGELPLPLQAKLLRVLENHEIQKLGSQHPRFVDFRLISATNRNLEQLVEQGKFREDLFYRLNLFELVVPPLRERLADIPLLSYSIINGVLGPERGRAVRMEKEVLSVFSTHPWRGNVRELRNVITYALYCMGPTETLLSLHHLPERFFYKTEKDFLQNIMATDSKILLEPEFAPRTEGGQGGGRPETERDTIVKALTQTGGNKLKAAKLLGIARSNLYKKIVALEIDVKK